jgi:hypothetical protein
MSTVSSSNIVDVSAERPDRSSLNFYRRRLRQPVRDLDRDILPV